MGQADKQDAGLAQPFELSAVEESQPPGDGMPGTWFRYKITQGDNVITGCCKGSRTSVVLDLEAIVAALNERRVGRRGRVHLTPPQRRGKGT